VGRFLSGLGVAPRRVDTIPAEADPEKQESLRINKLEPSLEEARQGKRANFVRCCALHPGRLLGTLWSFSRLFLRTSAGRRRFDVFGALHAVMHELVMTTNDSCITADSVCELLRRIAKLNLGVPITLVLDNARYQKCKLLTALASQLNIELLYLPAYSRNLNIIERLWKLKFQGSAAARLSAG